MWPWSACGHGLCILNSCTLFSLFYKAKIRNLHTLKEKKISLINMTREKTVSPCSVAIFVGHINSLPLLLVKKYLSRLLVTVQRRLLASKTKNP